MIVELLLLGWYLLGFGGLMTFMSLREADTTGQKVGLTIILAGVVSIIIGVFM